MANNEDVNTLKRRGRRRLVGAIALVLAAVIVLPMVFDSEPKGSAPPVSVRIPGEDESGFIPKVTPKAPAAPEQAAPARVEGEAAEPAAARPPEQARSEPPAEKAAPKIEVTVKKGAPAPAAPAEKPAAAEKARALAALAGAEQFIVPAGAYLDPSAVIGKLKSAKIPYYTEPIATKQGTVIRVRAGPFARRDAAERALKQLRDLGLKPGNVAARS